MSTLQEKLQNSKPATFFQHNQINFREQNAIPALILPSPKILPVSVVMIKVSELVMGTAIDKSVITAGYTASGKFSFTYSATNY